MCFGREYRLPEGGSGKLRTVRPGLSTHVEVLLYKGGRLTATRVYGLSARVLGRALQYPRC